MDAVDKLTVKLQVGRYHYVVEAEIKGFFDNMDHEWLGRMLAERIDDRAFLGLIRKWLRAGILDTTGAILHPVTGTPQGGGGLAANNVANFAALGAVYKSRDQHETRPSLPVYQSPRVAPTLE